MSKNYKSGFGKIVGIDFISSKERTNKSELNQLIEFLHKNKQYIHQGKVSDFILINDELRRKLQLALNKYASLV